MAQKVFYYHGIEQMPYRERRPSLRRCALWLALFGVAVYFLGRAVFG